MKCDILDLFLAADRIRRCTEADIHRHYLKVYPIVRSNTNREEYKALMLQAIDEDKAHCLKDDSCFLYYIRDEKYTAKGVSFYGKGNPMGMLALFYHIFHVMDKKTILIRFAPHQLNQVKTYKSLIVASSAKGFFKRNVTVSIRTDLIGNKVKALLDKRKSR